MAVETARHGAYQPKTRERTGFPLMNTSSPSSTIRLYHVALSPFCRKVRLVLAEKRIEVELVEDRF